MHELSIAMSLLEIAAQEAQQMDAPVIAVHVRLGPLSGVLKQALISAWELAREQSPLQEAKLLVQEMPLVAWCPLCGCPKNIPSPQYLCCPTCDTPTPDIRGGRELELSGLEVLEDVPNSHH